VCTLIAFHQVHRQYPLVVAANRDELYARRTSGPTVAGGALLVGRDLEKGGSWLGASARGFFVGLTNQRTPELPDVDLRSRGDVVLSALAQPSLEAAVDWLANLDARQYNAFNLLLGDAAELFVAYARPGSARIELAVLAPGIYALPNDRLGSLEFPKIDRAVELARPLADLAWPDFVGRAHAMLGDHVLPAPERIAAGPPWMSAELRPKLQALCVHTPAYGTRSASLLALGTSGVEHFLDAAGPPCVTPLIDRPELVAELRASQEPPHGESGGSQEPPGG
jgi:uncharacterized protein with NRDE domain